ncbi:MAG: glucosyltransferase domain-containing protein [Lentisphaeria bacterium]
MTCKTVLALLLISNSKENCNWKKHLSIIALLVFAISSYEVYATMFLVGFLAALFLQIYLGEKLSWRQLGNVFCLHVLYVILAIIAWGVLIFLSQALNLYVPGSGPARDILWLGNIQSLTHALLRLTPDLFGYFVWNSLFYFALLELWFAAAIAVYFTSKKRQYCAKLSLILLLMFLSMFALSIIQCKAQPYRTCQAFAVFVCFFFMLFYHRHGSRNFIVNLAFVFIILFQSKELALMSKIERESSEYATYCFRTLGHEIKQEFPDHAQREVVVIGYSRDWPKTSGRDTMQPPFFYSKHMLGHYQSMGLQQFYVDFHEQSPLLLKYHTGISAKKLSDEERLHWSQIVAEAKQPAWPAKGYIQEYDKQIVVNMGLAEAPKSSEFWLQMLGYLKPFLGENLQQKLLRQLTL